MTLSSWEKKSSKNKVFCEGFGIKQPVINPQQNHFSQYVSETFPLACLSMFLLIISFLCSFFFFAAQGSIMSAYNSNCCTPFLYDARNKQQWPAIFINIFRLLLCVYFEAKNTKHSDYRDHKQSGTKAVIILIIMMMCCYTFFDCLLTM